MNTHPHYDNHQFFFEVLNALKGYGASDNSWHNNAAPSIHIPYPNSEDDYLEIHIECIDKSLQEYPEDYVRLVEHKDDDMELDEIDEYDVNKIVQYVKNKLENN